MLSLNCLASRYRMKNTTVAKDNNHGKSVGVNRIGESVMNPFSQQQHSSSQQSQSFQDHPHGSSSSGHAQPIRQPSMLLPFNKGDSSNGDNQVDHTNTNNSISRQSSFKRYLSDQLPTDTSALIVDGFDMSNFPISQASGKHYIVFKIKCCPSFFFFVLW